MIKSILPIRIFRVAERSMEPTIREGDYVVVNCWYRKIGVGDIIVFYNPQDKLVLIKRVQHLNASKIFAVGDNLGASIDSRRFGVFDKRRVIGKVIYK